MLACYTHGLLRTIVPSQKSDPIRQMLQYLPMMQSHTNNLCWPVFAAETRLMNKTKKVMQK